jgi:hypothetical protein
MNGGIGGTADRTAPAGRLAILLVALCTVPPSDRAAAAQDTIPPGLGTLRRDDVAIRLRTPQIELQLLPLDEQVIRLLAPDTYQSLVALLRSRQAELDEAAGRAGLAQPHLFMVTFLGVVPEARFVPDDVEITSRGRLFRPAAVVPISPSWGSQQLAAREQAAALYLFEHGIGLLERMVVSYQGAASDAWSRAIPVLERERARVAARARPPAEP